MLTPLGQESPASEAGSSARDPSQGACLHLSRDWGCALGSLDEGGFCQASPPSRAPVLFVIAGISGGVLRRVSPLLFTRCLFHHLFLPSWAQFPVLFRGLRSLTHMLGLRLLQICPVGAPSNWHLCPVVLRVLPLAPQGAPGSSLLSLPQAQNQPLPLVPLSGEWCLGSKICCWVSSSLWSVWLSAPGGQSFRKSVCMCV